MNELLKNIIRYFAFLGIQVFVLFQVRPLHQFIVPYVYYVFILWLPFSVPRISLTLLGFWLGLSLDYFTHTPGLHAAACTLIAYVRPWLIEMLIFREGDEKNYLEPSTVSMGWAPYTTYVIVLTLLHHILLIFLEWIQFGSFSNWSFRLILFQQFLPLGLQLSLLCVGFTFLFRTV